MINVLVQGKSTVEPLVVYHLLLECHVSCHFSLKQQVRGSVASNWVHSRCFSSYQFLDAGVLSSYYLRWLTPSECPSLCFLVSAMICSERICFSFHFLKYRFHKRPTAWFCFINNLGRWSSLTATEYVWVLRSQVGQIMAHNGRTNYTICKLMMGINLSNNPLGCSWLHPKQTILDGPCKHFFLVPGCWWLNPESIINLFIFPMIFQFSSQKNPKLMLPILSLIIAPRWITTNAENP